MKTLRFLTAALIGGIGAVAAPAAAQPYDDYGYGYPNPGEQILQGVIDGLLGSRYDVSDRQAVRRCANAAVNEAWAQYRPYGGGYGFGSGAAYGGNYPQMRVTAITDVDRRASGLRVRGLIDSGLLYGRRGRADLIFRCNVDYRGRVWNVRVDRNPDFRPY
jgi:hypothetical protein